MTQEQPVRKGCAAAVVLLCAWLLFPASAWPAGGCADEPFDTGGSQSSEMMLSIPIEGYDLVCQPAVIHDREGNWTFYLHGRDALRVTRAELILDGKRYPMRNLDRPAPHAVLVDFTYDPVTLDAQAQLEVFVQGGGSSPLDLPLVVAPGIGVPPEDRQRWLVRAQFQEGDVQYILHGIRPGDPVRDRHLGEFPCRSDLLEGLRGIAIDRVRKVMPRYAEGDSIQWDARYLRELHYRDTQLRQYILYLEEGRSEAAYKEIVLGLPGVEKVFVNEDRAKTEGKKGKKG